MPESTSPSVTAATAVGTVQLPYGVTARVIAAKALGLVGAVDPTYEAIVWSVRLPRVLAAGVVGLALAVSGAAMQGIFKNPLASPDIIGVSSGGAVGAVIGIFLGWPQVNPWLVPGAAFAGDSRPGVLTDHRAHGHGGHRSTASLPPTRTTSATGEELVRMKFRARVDRGPRRSTT